MKNAKKTICLGLSLMLLSSTALPANANSLKDKLIGLGIAATAVGLLIYSLWPNKVSKMPDFANIPDNFIEDKKFTKQQRVRSSVLGGAIGDAMGRPTEFITNTDAIEKRYPNCLRGFEDFKKNDFLTINRKPIAAYTDDTAMSKVVLQTLITAKKRKLSKERTMTYMASAFVHDMRKRNGWAAPYRAPGNCCMRSCRKLAKRLMGKIDEKRKWWRAGGKNDGGCGSVMRAHPFGLVFYKNPQRAEDWAVEHSRITHGAPIALAACAAMAKGVAYAMQGKGANFIAKQMIQAAQKYDQGTANKMIDAYKKGIANRKACKTFTDKFERSKPVFKKYLGWAAHDAIAATTYLLALCPDDPKTAIALGVNTPGDSDSIATMAGALIGARKNILATKKDKKYYAHYVEGYDKLYNLANEAGKGDEYYERCFENRRRPIGL